ncbi:MAG: hypothetical protein HY289_06070 [Planctomycetes bacterium]|nr:hypothetical protein [Planctomycetota bacterium]
MRRAVAARESNAQTISAYLYESGKKPRLIVIGLDALHSPKAFISLSDRRYVRALQGMASAQSRIKMPPIDVQPLGAKGQKTTVPLAQVALDP